MNTLDRLEKLEEQTSSPTEQETIIPAFQNPDECVFCTDKYDSTICLILRTFYNYKNNTDLKKQNKESCIHHTDGWLRHSYRTAGFIQASFPECKTNGHVIDILENKEKREELLTKFYNETKDYSSAIDLYLPKSSGVNNEKRYNNAFDIEDDILVQNKIIHDKVKTYCTNAIEVLNAFDEETQ